LANCRGATVENLWTGFTTLPKLEGSFTESGSKFNQSFEKVLIEMKLTTALAFAFIVVVVVGQTMKLLNQLKIVQSLVNVTLTAGKAII